ncbi:MAG: Rieske (2Fe-2S) protein [Flavipsychrobacter sp.]|nr:Rieske (2Fe-2S) protein [Flavipsychrobacter sp.]
MERKDFLKKTFAMCGLAMIPAAVLESCSKSNTTAPSNVNFTIDLSVSANAALLNVGGYLVSNSVIVIHVSSGIYNAFSDICTHEGCSVGYNATSAQISCPCHGGQFSPQTGAVISGPPPSALKQYTVTQSGNVLTIKS